MDYYNCAKCNEIFSGSSSVCECCTGCENIFCCKTCAELIEKDGEDTSCCICRDEHITDYMLLIYFLNKYNLSRKEAMDLCFEELKKERI